MARSKTTIGAGIVTPEIGKDRRFGQPNGNPQAQGVTMRHFYAWVLNKASRKELEEYEANPKNPFARVAFVRAVLANDTKRIDSLCAITNQAHGLPKQEVEVNNAPTTLVIKKS